LKNGPKPLQTAPKPHQNGSKRGLWRSWAKFQKNEIFEFGIELSQATRKYMGNTFRTRWASVLDEKTSKT
jgi:hypothetical protein